MNNSSSTPQIYTRRSTFKHPTPPPKVGHKIKPKQKEKEKGRGNGRRSIKHKNFAPLW